MNKVISNMISRAHTAIAHSYSPYSGFRVAACICTDQGNLYTGVNVENASYGLTLCAEASAICQMVTAGKHVIQSMVILAGTNELCAPCGACRQRIYEFSTPQTLVHLCTQSAILLSMTMSELLPLPFDFKPK